jgi:hypothetical protein
MQLGYLKVTVDPENNTATVWEVTVAKLSCWECPTTPQLYNSPVINDTITFPLKSISPIPHPIRDANNATNKEQIEMGNRHAVAYESGSATNNINIVTSQGLGAP